MVSGSLVTAVLLLCCYICNSISAEEEHFLQDSNFRGWLAEHGEGLGSLDLQEAYSNWLENSKFVQEHNLQASRGLFHYTVALNSFAHKVSFTD